MTLRREHIRKPHSEDYSVDITEVKHVEVFETSISSAAWTAITLPAGINCDSALCKCRLSTTSWKLSHLSTGTPYFTFEAGGSFTLDIDKDAGDILFYVQPSTNDTFEVIVSHG